MPSGLDAERFKLAALFLPCRGLNVARKLTIQKLHERSVERPSTSQLAVGLGGDKVRGRRLGPGQTTLHRRGMQVMLSTM